MYTLRRWWDRHWLQILLVSLVISSAWIVRQTQATALLEVYQLVTRPFQLGPSKQQQMTDAKVMELEVRLQELESQNKQLLEQLGYVAKNKGEGIHAPIVGRSADNWWQQITIGRGSQAGIKEGFVVTAPGGLVGRVISTTPHTSRVLLISDPNSRVGVTVSRSRYMGVLQGQSENRAVMQFFERVPDVRKGDVVTTSSVSQLFPSGLPVGRVKSINLSKAPAPEATIILAAPLSALEWVIVYPGEAENPSGSQ